METLWKYKDVAKRLNVCEKTVKRMWDRGEIPEPVINRPGMVRWNPDHFALLANFSMDNRGQSRTNEK